MHIRTTIVAAVASLSFAGTGLGQAWIPSELTASDGAINNFFGQSLALDGDTCVIGALGTNSFTGSAYVFTNTNGTWVQVQKLTATDGASGDYFGRSVAIDGNTCVIGAYVFTKTGGTWSQVQKLTATGGASNDQFGDSVAIDGDTCVIGAPGANDERGCAYVFTNTNGTWVQVQKLTPTSGVNYGFGDSLALDGDTCVIGAPDASFYPGNVYVFTNTNGTWSEVQKLTATDGHGGDGFGGCVDLDGSTCVIGGAPWTLLAGSAYVFTNTGGTWSQVQKLTAKCGASGDYFGRSVAIDGNTCVIGAYGTNSSTGSAYAYSDIGGSWSQVAELTPAGGASGDQFGASVAIDGTTCVIGAPKPAPEPISNTGSAYVYGSSSAATGACCYDGLCFSITESECTAVGGSFTAEACSADTACPASCAGDTNGDGTVDVFDLLAVIDDWGACP